MKKITKLIVAASLLFSTSPFVSTSFAETAKEKGWKIMKGVEQLPTFQKSLSENAFKIYNPQGKLLFTKKARTASFVENYQDADNRLSRGITYFFSPADDKGNGALLLEKGTDQDDDQWLYLKGLRKPKRVIGSDKSSSFMGSDFSNGDMASRNLEDSTYTWLSSETISFKKKKLKVEKIEIEFKDQQQKSDYGYGKMISWVHPSSGLVFKGEIYDLNGQLFKKLKLNSFTVKKNKDGKKIFFATGMEMKNMIKGTKTILRVSKLKVEKKAKKIKPSIFTLAYLNRKWW